ncbi:MAG: SDR family oxidoreductase [Bacteroidia bacterium]|nr:SDR family oxidoreductase [Bacteroidia bacterium]
MNILYIGGTGNISMACVKQSLAQGHEVYVLNRGKSGLELPEGVHSIVADIHNEEAVAAAIRDHRFDVVANFIAFVPSDVERDIRLFSGKIGQYLFISSASCYQKPLSHPIITESTPLANPFWQYSRDKIACEDLLMAAYRDGGFPITIVRPSLTYESVIPVAIGGWTEFTIIDRIRRGKPVIVHGDGSSIWTITHSRDFAKGFVGLLGHQQAIGQAFHITSDELLTWNQIYEAVMAAAGATVEMVHIPSDYIASFDDDYTGSLLGDKAVSTIFDNSKIKRFVPGFVATTPFKRGIEETVAWLEANPSRIHISPETDAWMDLVIAAYRR